jgi:hypothetical protein
MLTLPVWKLKKAEAGLSINSLQGLLRLQQRLRQHRLQQPPALLTGLVELLLQLVAEGHQFVHLGDDAVLFGEGWEGDGSIFRFF